MAIQFDEGKWGDRCCVVCLNFIENSLPGESNSPNVEAEHFLSIWIALDCGIALNCFPTHNERWIVLQFWILLWLTLDIIRWPLSTFYLLLMNIFKLSLDCACCFVCKKEKRIENVFNSEIIWTRTRSPVHIKLYKIDTYLDAFKSRFLRLLNFLDVLLAEIEIKHVSWATKESQLIFFDILPMESLINFEFFHFLSPFNKAISRVFEPNYSLISLFPSTLGICFLHLKYFSQQHS